MKRLLVIFPLCLLLLTANVLGEEQGNKDVKPEEETRYLEVVVPIWADCNYNNHKTRYGTVRFASKARSVGGRTVYVGDTPIYIYAYVDDYNNYYEPYFTGYTYSYEDNAYVPGCPLQ